MIIANYKMGQVMIITYLSDSAVIIVADLPGGSISGHHIPARQDKL